MIEIENLYALTGTVVLAAGIIWGVMKYKKIQITEDVESDNRIDEAFYRINKLDEKLDKEQEDADDHHKLLYGKIDLISKDVSFIKGKIANL